MTQRRTARAAVLAAALALAPAAGALAETPQRTAVLTVEQGQALARDAFVAGDHAVARALALRLLEARPGDPRALLIVAATSPALGDPAQGRAAGRAAWAGARGAPVLRYEIARHTARAAEAEGRPDAASFWLRRAMDMAPDPAAVEGTRAEYRRVAAARRLSWRLDLSVQPSSNLNGGSSGSLLMVNGVIPVGSLSGGAQALSGARVLAQGRVALKLPPGPRHRAEVSLTLQGARHLLSSEARQLAPEIRGSDLDFLTAEAGLALDWAAPGLQAPVRLTLGAGHTLYGGRDLGPHLRAGFDVPVLTRPNAAVRAGLSRERQWRDGGPVDATVLRLDGGRALGEAGRLFFGVSARDVSGPTPNTTYTGAALDLAFAPARPVGPAELTLRARLGWRDHDFYTLGPIGVTDGRQDRTLGLAVDAAFPGLSVLGYAPRLSIESERTRSNVSRFDTRTLGVTLGVASRF